MNNDTLNKMKYRDTEPARKGRLYRGIIGADPLATLAIVTAIHERKTTKAKPKWFSRLVKLNPFFWIGGVA
jgi:hypothetical protein